MLKLFCKDITLIIPTLNRYEHVITYLNYLTNYNYGGVVILADSSESEIFNKTKLYINNKVLNFNILHVDCKNLKNFEAIKKVSELVETEYCMFIPDDDFVIINTLEKCKNFLIQNLDYSAVGGITFLAILNNYNKK